METLNCLNNIFLFYAYKYMPEGPEVKYLTNYLNHQFKNKTLTKINIKGGRYLKHGNPSGYDNFVKKLPLKVEAIKCKGKFMYWLFKDSDVTLWNTLGMSGWWIKEKENHNNLEFVFNNAKIYFNDMRNFGTIKFCKVDKLQKKLDILGPDILDKKNQFELFMKRIKRKRNDTYIASALLDQKVAAGCGNYIRAECLYICKISPFRKIKDLSDDEINKIWDVLRQLGWNYYDEKEGKKLKIIDGKYKLSAKYKKKGPSKYKPGPGFFLVYRQDKDPSGNKVKHDKIKDRMIHYVPSLQK
jgi:DNA-formamidopyrimidine glycosylase